jgi:seryl-tRNA synthetase
MTTRCEQAGSRGWRAQYSQRRQDFNEVVKKWAPEGFTEEKRDCLSHHEVMTRAEVYDGERGVKLVGHRGYFLRKWGVLLNQALINYGLHFLVSKGYDPLQPPYFMKAEYMAKTAQLEQFDEELYKVIEDKDAEDKFLIATSEQPISAMFAEEWLTSQDLPMKFAGYSSCFRKEAGAHGRDAWGLYRIHQFEKVRKSSLRRRWPMLTLSSDRTVPLRQTRRIVAGSRRHEERGRRVLPVSETALPGGRHCLRGA